MKKILLLAMFFIAAVSYPAFVSADASCTGENGFQACTYLFGGVNETKPQILINFSQTTSSEVDLQQASLRYKEGGGELALQTPSIGDDDGNLVYMYQPQINLPDNDFIFNFRAQNAFGAVIEGHIEFSVNATNLDAWMISPKSQFLDRPNFGVAQEDDFDLRVGLERPADCAWSSGPLQDGESLPDMFTRSENMNRANNGLSAVYENFRIDPFIEVGYSGEAELKDLYLVCREIESERYGYTNVQVGVDETLAEITFDISPRVVTQRELRRSNVDINTDDLSVCTVENVDHPEGATATGIQNLPGTEFTNFNDFKETLTEQILFGGGINNATYGFDVKCVNLANHETNESFEIEVDIQDVQQINIINPSTTVNQADQVLRATSTGEDECSYSVNGGQGGEFDEPTYSNSLDRFVYEADISLQEGDNELLVDCRRAEPVTRTTILDTTPPSPIQIITLQESCSLNSLDITFESDDNQSSIAYYNYSLTVSDLYEANYSTTRTSVSPSIPDTLEGEEILISAFAVDRAGNIGTAGTRSVTVTNSSIPACDTTPPTARLNTFVDEDDVKRAQVQCEDDFSGCQETFDYSRHENTTASCTYGSSTSLDDTFTVTKTEKICFRVYDNNANNASGDEIVFPAYRKEDGESCDADSECASNWCSEGVCTEASCNDGLQNGFQTGIDCGGPNCDACEIGAQCKENSDCDSGYCDDGTCAENVCVNEEANCGGPHCDACEDGLSCNVNSDCESRNCEDGVCVARAQDPGTQHNGDPQQPSPGVGGEEEGVSTVGLILLILGILMMLGGLGSILYSMYVVRPEEENNTSTLKSSPGFESVSLPGRSTKRQDSSKNSMVSKSSLSKAKRKAAKQRRKSKRRQLLDEFDTSAKTDKQKDSKKDNTTNTVDKATKENTKESNADKTIEKKTSTKENTKATKQKETGKGEQTSTKDESNNNVEKEEKSSEKSETSEKTKTSKQKDSDDKRSAINKLKEFNEKNGK